MKTVAFKVIGMSCASCANSIEHVLSHTKGIIKAEVNLATDTAFVSFDANEINETQVIDAIGDAGFDATIKKETKKTVVMHVEGMTCATCASNIEHAIESLKGIDSFHVNLANDQLTLTYHTDEIKLSDIKKKVFDFGYELTLNEDRTEDLDPDVIKMQKAKKKMQLSASITSVMMILMVMHVFFISIPHYTYIVAVMGFPVVFIIRKHVHIGSFKSLKHKRPNMDVLVSLGSLPPYLIGLMGLFLPIITFIEMATTIMTFHLIGKFLETRAKGKASMAIKKLLALGSKTARIIVDDEQIEILTSELSVGDLMVIRPGEKIPSDGIVMEGSSLIDESIATGESMPVKRTVNDLVIGATINKQGLLKVKVTKTGDDTFLSQVIKLVEACQGSKVPIQAFADKITGYFVPAIMILTVLTFASFNLFSNVHLSILQSFEPFLPWVNSDQSILTLSFVTATAVLVIACPCALGLGTPTALMVGSGIGAEKGILIRNGEAVQTLKDTKVIAFDKTGTLTYGKPQVTDIVGENKDQILKIAYTLESGSEHPLASAIIEEAKKQGMKQEKLKGFESYTGMGISGDISNTKYYIGNQRLMEQRNIELKHMSKDIESLEKQAKTVMIVSDQEQVLGLIAVADEIKKETKKAIEALHKLNIKTVMITGDNQTTALAIGKKAGISEVVSNVLPDGKVAQIEKLQAAYGLVAMVGDGINDAPALKQANVGIAIGTGTDIAIESSDITLIRGDISTIISAIKLSKAIFRKIKQNYFWAWFYNAIAIPFAMLGLLHPMIGAAAMSLSSLNVIYNSLRLKKVNLSVSEVNDET